MKKTRKTVIPAHPRVRADSEGSSAVVLALPAAGYRQPPCLAERWLTDSTHWYTRGSAESEIAHAGIVECGLHWLAWPGRGFRCFARLCSRLDTGLATRGRLVYRGEHRRSRQNVLRHGAKRKHSKKWQSPHKPRFFWAGP